MKKPQKHILQTLLPLLILFLFQEIPKAQDNRFITYGVDQGLPQAYVYTISQNSEGYLWIGTGDGLARFDGINFTNYSTSDSLAGNFISCNLNTPKGQWFGHMNGNLSCKSKVGFQKIISGTNAKSSVTNIHMHSSGNIWFSDQNDGLMQIGENNKVEPIAFLEGAFPVFSFEFINSNELIVGTIDGLKHCLINENKQLVVVNDIDGINRNKINCICKARSGKGFFVLSGTNSIYFLEITKNGFTTSKIGEDTGLQMEGIQNIFEDQDSNLWISTFGEGVHKLAKDPKGFHLIKTYDTSNGLQSDNIKLVFEDSEGNIWLSVYGKGLARLIDPAYTFYSPEEEQYGSEISAISIDGKYEWFGSEKGLLRRNISNHNEIRFFDSYRGLPFDKITALYPRNENDLWIGTEKNGVYRLNIKNDKLVRQFFANGILENSINSITGTKDQIWIATKKGACSYNVSADEFNWYTISKGGLPHNCVNHIMIDSKGRIWLSTLSNSIAFIQNNEIAKFNLSADNSFINIRSIAEDSKGNIWVGTLGNGVFIYQEDSITNITSNDGLLSDYCYSLTPDKQNRMWVTHRGGLSRINISDFKIKLLQENIGISKSDEFQVNSSFSDRNENLWFGLNKGVLRFNPSLEKITTPPPVLKIKAVKINDELVPVSEKIVLSPGRYKIKLEFVGVYFKEPELVKYRHTLEGYDEKWTDFSTTSEVTYHGVSDGRFKFLLEASNGDGVTCEYPVSINIYIKTPFWKQTWFYLVLFLFSLIVIVFYIKNREKKLKKENRILEEKINERTIEVVRQKEEIEKQKDLIESANKDITDSIKYASKIQAAVIPPTKYLEKVLNESFIINKPKAIVSGDFYWVTKVDDKTIVALADCTGHGVPGAFMSMLGVTLLNEIVNHKKITDTSEILNILRKNIIISLRQSHEDTTPSDGMDISLIVLDHANSKLTFSGAFNPLLILRNDKIITLKADRMPIGIYHQNNIDFTSHEIDLNSGDMLYLYTDGYPDQFGGEEDKKFTTRQFKNVLLDIHQKPMMVQKIILENTMEKWMNGTEQLDDITVMGIRI
ncbi:hypothetical protein BZG01_19285 [Labilibaculum manganireducens]|uniref:PPM-type phosphatase domain-containing protein n=1 Tax=Labilibaculum manganireducens TaxID=1940525 RepID=A0A2N3HTV1_9BACT|nr:two-component regulator propeller domain-containing protein [Labilibaculum manganireducens]PKQ61467.1 hypothetical protein BZG01_19285 [Labilibaculum manganireducens]